MVMLPLFGNVLVINVDIDVDFYREMNILLKMNGRKLPILLDQMAREKLLLLKS